MGVPPIGQMGHPPSIGHMRVTFTFSHEGGVGGLGGWLAANFYCKKCSNPKFTFSQVGGGSQLLMLSPKMLKSNIHIFTDGWGGGGVGGQLLMRSPKMLKSKIHIFTGGWGGGGGCIWGGWQPTFDAKSKNATI